MEKINLVEILENYPTGTKLYSPIFGEVTFMKICKDNPFSIMVITSRDEIASFSAEGQFYQSYKDSECLLFPSKYQRDWSKFKIPEIPEIDPKIFKPYDKVLVRDYERDSWRCSFFSNFNDDVKFPYRVMDSVYAQCIPYNEETKHLVGSTGEPPTRYKHLCKTIE